MKRGKEENRGNSEGSNGMPPKQLAAAMIRQQLAGDDHEWTRAEYRQLELVQQKLVALAKQIYPKMPDVVMVNPFTGGPWLR